MGRPSRRDILWGLGSSLTVACSPSPSATPTRPTLLEQARGLLRRGTLRILYPKGSLANLQPAVDAFHRQAGVSIELKEASLDEIASEMLLAGTVDADPGYDIALPATFGIPDLVESGLLAPLDELAASHAHSDAFATSLYQVGDRYKGKLYGHQTDGDAYVMFYDRSLLDDPEHQARYAEQHGTQLAVPLTWAELDRQLAFFHTPDDGRFGGSLYRNLNYSAWEFWARLHGQGKYPVTDDMRSQLHSPEGIAALEALVQATRFLEPGALQNGLFENFASYADGTKYCNVGWGGTQKHLRSAPESKMKGRLAFGAMPGGDLGGKAVPMPFFNWGWNYVVSAKSPRPDLAYLFILFACSPDISTACVREADGYFDPFRTEHYRDPGIVQTYGEAFLAVHRESMSSCLPDFYLQGQGRYLAALKQGVQSAVIGQVQPAKALAMVSERWERLTDEIGRARQIEQWKLLKSSYPEGHQAVLT